MKPARAIAAIVLSTCAVAGLSCSQGTPVAPEGSLVRMTINPDRITATGAATVTVTVLKPNGTPVNPGTEVRLSTTIGQIEPVVSTDSAGIAIGTLRGDGRVGTATVSAAAGSVAPVTAQVEIGSFAGSLSLQVTPTSVPEGGGKVTLLVLVRDTRSLPLPSAAVNFTAQIGTLASGGGFRFTNANGEASDTLTVSANDVGGVTGDSFQVGAEVGSSSGGTITKTVTLTIARPPIASFNTSRSGLTVIFTDTSTGNPTKWAWTFGDPGNNTSTQKNPTFTYSAAGTYAVTLTVTNSFGSSSTSQFVTVTGN